MPLEIKETCASQTSLSWTQKTLEKIFRWWSDLLVVGKGQTILNISFVESRRWSISLDFGHHWWSSSRFPRSLQRRTASNRRAFPTSHSPAPTNRIRRRRSPRHRSSNTTLRERRYLVWRPRCCTSPWHRTDRTKRNENKRQNNEQFDQLEVEDKNLNNHHNDQRTTRLQISDRNPPDECDLRRRSEHYPV